MKWLVADSLYCPEAFFASHLDSYSHYLREAGEDVETACWNFGDTGSKPFLTDDDRYDVAFSLDAFVMGANVKAAKHVAQVAALCSPMPWEVRKPDGSPAYDAVISSIPWMVEAARDAGCRSFYMPLAFDTRARVCGMGVKRDLDCIFIGTVGPNHQRRAALLEELGDIVTVMPPVFGREYFRTLARAKVVFSPHAEWARGGANNMRCFEACGLGAVPVFDGEWPEGVDAFGFQFDGTAGDARMIIAEALSCQDEYTVEGVLCTNTYIERIPSLIEIARSL